MTDREKICRELSEACGRIWIKWDEKCGGSYTYIDGKKCAFLHPDEVLREVMKWKDFIEFIEKECKAEVWWQIPIAYILNDGEFQDKLLIAAHKWVTESEGGEMTEKAFKEQFVVTFLATYAATIYDSAVYLGQHDRLRKLPVEDAEGLAEDAWNHRKKILEL